MRLRRLLLVGVALATAGLGIAAYEANLLRALELDTVDTRFSLRGTQKPASDIVLVEIDADTFTTLNKQWPFPRGTHAQVIDRIARDHPKAIAYDVQFTEPSPGDTPGNPSGDTLALLTAMLNANGKTVMATTETDAKGNTRFLGSTSGTALLNKVNSRPGNALLPIDPGAVDRRFSYKVDGLKTFAVVTAEVASGHPVNPRIFGGHDAWIDYAGPTGTFPAVSFGTVYQGKLPPGFFRNKVVVIGPSAQSLQDVHATSTASDMPGVEIQANAIQTVRRGLPLKPAPDWLNIALILVLAAVAPLASMRLGPIGAIALGVAVGAAFTVATQLAFNGGLILSFVYPLGALVLSEFGALLVHLITVAFERERVRDLFSRFVPENVVDEVLASADQGLRLGGVQREATVMFTDLRGFTSFAESLTPDRVIEVLNRYLSEMSDAILDHGGTLVAYMGDGIMAVFGAPIVETDHADRALATAREMLTVRLPRFNAWLKEQRLGRGFRMGIGLNTGSVMSGNVGSERRVEYTAVGDATNTASRIEALTKGTPHQLFLAESTQAALIDPPDDLIFVDEFELRGRVASLGIWSLANDGAGAPRERAQRTSQSTKKTPVAAAAAPPSDKSPGLASARADAVPAKPRDQPEGA